MLPSLEADCVLGLSGGGSALYSLRQTGLDSAVGYIHE